ncbi:MAG: hypothetical protein AAF628_03295 [Planctomycetota bacterium]
MRRAGRWLQAVVGGVLLPVASAAAQADRAPRSSAPLVHGRVVDEAGTPVPGAVIEVWHAQHATLPAAVRDLGWSGVALGATGRARANGAFSVPLSAAGGDRLVARADARRSPVIYPVAAGQVVELVVLPSVPWRGRVVERTRAGAMRGVANADVRLLVLPTSLSDCVPVAASFAHGIELRAAVDEAGWFAVRLPTSASAVVVARQGERVAWRHAEQPDVGALELSTDTIPVRAITASAQAAPIAGASVRWCTMGYEADVRRTDRFGVARLRGDSAEPVIAQATASGYRPQLGRAVQRGGDPAVEFRMRQSHRLVGRLLDASGVPLARAPLAVVGATTGSALRGTFAIAATTDAAGRLQVDGVVPDQTLDVWVAVPSGDWLLLGRFRGDREVDLGAVRLDPSARVRGSITQAQQPAGGVPVLLQSVDVQGEPTGAWREVRADHAGRFRATGLLPGPCRVLSWSSTGRGRFRVVAAAAAPELSLELESAPQLGGIVRDATGAPAAGLLVRSQHHGGGASSRDLGATAVTAADGTFSLPCLEDGRTWSVWVVAHRDGGVAQANVHDVAPGTLDLVLTLQLP